MNSQDVYIIGSKGVPARYGGFETFVDRLVTLSSGKITYYVSCLGEPEQDTYGFAKCFGVNVPNIGSAKAILYDLIALNEAIKLAKANSSSYPIFYICACRIGPFITHFRKKIKRINGILIVNPDGHEWMRSKWNSAIKRYWKISEKLMVKNSDILACDSLEIERYIQDVYKKFSPCTTYIAYGGDNVISATDDSAFKRWLDFQSLKPFDYYLVVGRLVPENNFSTIIREFSQSHTKRKLVLVCDKKGKFWEIIKNEIPNSDDRIKFVGTIYDQNLLHFIRKNAYAYIHGHSVGGTNPSLLEALGSTDLNLLYDVPFNSEVAKESAFYWNLEKGSLGSLIDSIDNLDTSYIQEKGNKAKSEIDTRYRWSMIVDKNERLFHSLVSNTKNQDERNS